MIAYHAVTDRPLLPGQQIVFDETHRSGVYLRVHEKRNLIRDIYSNPEKYRAHPLGHHTAVALRELALEEVRARKYPQYPSRMACLYASATLEEAERWADFFAKIGRPTYSIVRLDCRGPFFPATRQNASRVSSTIAKTFASPSCTGRIRRRPPPFASCCSPAPFACSKLFAKSIGICHINFLRRKALFSSCLRPVSLTFVRVRFASFYNINILYTVM